MHLPTIDLADCFHPTNLRHRSNVVSALKFKPSSSLSMLATQSINNINYTIHVNSQSPMSVYINQDGNTTTGNYVYAISNYSTYLIENEINNISQLALYFNKKYGKPVYLNINGVMPPLAMVFDTVCAMISEAESI